MNRKTYWDEELGAYLLNPGYLGGMSNRELIQEWGLLEDEVEWNDPNRETTERSWRSIN